MTILTELHRKVERLYHNLELHRAQREDVLTLIEVCETAHPENLPELYRMLGELERVILMTEGIHEYFIAELARFDEEILNHLTNQ